MRVRRAYPRVRRGGVAGVIPEEVWPVAWKHLDLVRFTTIMVGPLGIETNPNEEDDWR